jgi:undecaprenyl-diphosphatase
MLFGNTDIAAIEAVQLLAGPAQDVFFRLASFLGNPAFWLLAAALLYWQGREKSGIFLFNLVLITAAAAALLKAFFAVPRPSGNSIRVMSEGIIPASLYGSSIPSYSFPSGHSAIAAAVATHFRKVFSGLGRAALVILPLGVAFSRMYLGMHFLSDVLFGLLLGVAAGLANERLSSLFEKYEFRLSRVGDEIVFVAISGVALITIAFLDVPVMAVAVLGVYAGFYASREIGLKQSPVRGIRLPVKLSGGLASLLVLFFGTFFATASAPLAAFLAGIWITLGYPFLYEKIVKRGIKGP